jgi:Xaa-Pro aminopeptidase
MNRLIYADSEHHSDLYYATGFLAPDAFLYFEKGARTHIVLNQLEYDRGAREAQVDKVISLSGLIEEMKRTRKFASKSPSTAEWITAVLRKHQVLKVAVASNFPVGLADALRAAKIKVQVVQGELFPERLVKNSLEVKHIRKSLKVTSRLLDVAIEAIRTSRPDRRGFLMHGRVSLTSEKVQSLIRTEAARLGFRASHPIVAGGLQACDPHERGHGKLKAGQLIILDIFPKDLGSGYWGDMTRTVVKGRASEAQRKLFYTVHEGQKLAISKLRAGIDGKKVHDAVQAFFVSRGYPTGNGSGRYEGFFHGTGHGLGLDIHEAPRVSSMSNILKRGNVVTVEPGLYYAEVGGVRIEDVVLLEKDGCQMLSRHPVRLEI